MLDFIFSDTSYWSWSTFILYYFISVVVVSLCKIGKGFSFYGNTIGIINTSKVKRKDKFLPFFIAYVILVLLATVRSSMVGPDTWKYVEDFLSVDSHELKEFDWSQLLLFHQTEPIYLLFNIIVRSFTDDYHIYFLCLYSLVAASYILFIRHFIQKDLNISFLKLFIVFYVGNMSGMRSALATAPLLLSFISLDRGNYKRSFLYSLFAIFCHYTMLYNIFIVLGVFLVKNVRHLQKINWVILAFLGTLTLSLSETSSLLGVFADTKYSFYTETASEMTFIGSMPYVILGFFLCSFFNVFNNSQNFQVLMYICLFFLITYPFIYVTAAYRISYYYAMPRLIIWCAIFSYLGNRYARCRSMINIGCEVIVFVYMLLRFYKSALDGYFEYVI